MHTSLTSVAPLRLRCTTFVRAIDAQLIDVQSECVVFLCLCTRLLDNPSVRLMWHTYCHTDKVSVPTFLGAVALFMKEQLHMVEADIQDLLTEGNKAALVAAVDSDGSGKVCALFLLPAVPESARQCLGPSTVALSKS